MRREVTVLGLHPSKVKIRSSRCGSAWSRPAPPRPDGRPVPALRVGFRRRFGFTVRAHPDADVEDPQQRHRLTESRPLA